MNFLEQVEEQSRLAKLEGLQKQFDLKRLRLKTLPVSIRFTIWQMEAFELLMMEGFIENRNAYVRDAIQKHLEESIKFYLDYRKFTGENLNDESRDFRKKKDKKINGNVIVEST